VGCKPRAMCMARPLDSEGEYCPSHSVCTKECQSEEMLCPDGVDTRGCRNADLCIPRGKDKNGKLCPELCPPKCTDAEYFCPGLIESNGCAGPAHCVERKVDDNQLTCPEICPISCSERELKVPGETDARGCLMEDTCIANECYAFDVDYWGNDLNNCGMKTDTAQECQNACAQDDGCVEFTWIGIALADDDNNINKCCLKSAAYDNKQSSPGLVSGPKTCA